MRSIKPANWAKKNMRKFWFILLFLLISINVKAHNTGDYFDTSPYSVFDKTTAPTVNDDYSGGFGRGSIWLNYLGPYYCVLMDGTIGAANWICFPSVVAGTMLYEDGSVMLFEDGSVMLYE